MFARCISQCETLPPRIDDRRAGALIIARVAGNDRQPVAQRRRRDDQIGLRERMPALRPSSASSRHLVVEFGAPAGIGDKFNAEADFGKSHGADVELLERLRGDEGEHFRFGLGAAQLGEDIRIEQPTRHRSTPRTGMRPRPRLFYLDAPGSDCQRMRVC